MKILRSLDQLTHYRQSITQPIGFVPTMGSLHEGHLSLVECAKQHSNVIGVSIFVNPTQFAPHEDFDSYPRDEQADLVKLEASGVDFVYLPQVADIYPESPSPTLYQVGEIGRILEGEARPHFFDGVTQVVSILFDQVKPDIAVFGEKDFQQLAVIRQMVNDLALDIRIIGAPIIREENGLAMSSRNRYLSEEQHKIAAHLYATLQDVAKDITQGTTISKALDVGKQQLLNCRFLSIDYLTLCDSQTLALLTSYAPNQRLLVAARLGDVRLIDNINVA